MSQNVAWKNVTIANNFMFRVVMDKEETCKPLLEMILNTRIKTLRYINGEQSIEVVLKKKGIRLDIFAIGEDGTAYDIEMQVDARYKADLGKRSRYYAALRDMTALKKGKSYKHLRKNYVIFICTFDPFDTGRGIYTFQETCQEDKKLILQDDAARIFINVHGDKTGMSEGLANFTDYVATGKVADDYTRKIDEIVEVHRNDDRLEDMYMFYNQDWLIAKEEAKAEGREEGRAEGKAEGEEKGRWESAKEIALNLYKEKMPVEMIAKVTKLTIQQVKDLVGKAAVL
ncbi:MAG: Rpn family recombination-promoting nuclease/putative transposase [Selenomonadaceae bacterium]|nr:Rpn family recombination-promoting nuclease/putative transposase [Selenomonadaceae bacterium]